MYDPPVNQRSGGRAQEERAMLRRAAYWAGFALVIAALLILKSDIHFPGFPEPIRVDRGDHVDVYSWEALVAMVLVGMGSLAMAFTSEIDPNASSAQGMLQRTGRRTAWIVGIGIWFGVLHLAFILLGTVSAP